MENFRQHQADIGIAVISLQTIFYLIGWSPLMWALFWIVFYFAMVNETLRNDND